VSGVCEFCAKPFTSSAATARFCSPKCRKSAFKARREAAAAVVAPAVGEGATVRAVLAELTAAGRVEGHLGASALALAARIDSSTSVQGFAALVKELRLTMLAALTGAAEVADPVDELRGRRDRKRAG